MRAIALTALCLLSARPPPVRSPRRSPAEVVSYTAGTNAHGRLHRSERGAGLAAAARPGAAPFDGDVTPFNAPYAASDVVSIGAGGSLVVRFDHPVSDDAANPYGIDLLVFGNAFLGIDFGTGLADGTLIFTEPGQHRGESGRSHLVRRRQASTPTARCSRRSRTRTRPDPFDFGGTIPTSYTRPVNPALTAADFAGKTTAEIAALYGGSGGGAGIDLGALGLPWIEYVRVFQLAGDGCVDRRSTRFADVPEPDARALLGVAGARTHLVSSAKIASQSGGGGVARELADSREQHARRTVLGRAREQLIEDALRARRTRARGTRRARARRARRCGARAAPADAVVRDELEQPHRLLCARRRARGRSRAAGTPGRAPRASRRTRARACRTACSRPRCARPGSCRRPRSRTRRARPSRSRPRPARRCAGRGGSPAPARRAPSSARAAARAARPRRARRDTRAAAWSGCAIGAPQNATTPSPWKSFTVPSSLEHRAADRLEVLVQVRDHRLGRQLLGERREAAEIDEHHGELAARAREHALGRDRAAAPRPRACSRSARACS